MGARWRWRSRTWASHTICTKGRERRASHTSQCVQFRVGYLTPSRWALLQRQSQMGHSRGALYFVLGPISNCSPKLTLRALLCLAALYLRMLAGAAVCSDGCCLVASSPCEADTGVRPGVSCSPTASVACFACVGGVPAGGPAFTASSAGWDPAAARHCGCWEASNVSLAACCVC